MALDMHLKANLGGTNEYISLKVKIIDINYKKLPKEILERNDVLNEYSYLIDRIRY